MRLVAVTLVISLILIHASKDAFLSGDVMYAQKALEALGEQAETGFLCGVACMDGVLLAKLHLNKNDNVHLLEKGSEGGSDKRAAVMERTRSLDPDSPLASGRSLHKLEDNVLVAISGWQADAAYLLRHMQDACKEYRNTFGTAMSARQVAEEVASFLHVLSVEDGSTRPLVVSVLIAGISRAACSSEHDTLSLQEPVQGEEPIILGLDTGAPLGSVRSCLYKVDCAGVIREFAAAATGGLVSDDLRYLALPRDGDECDGGAPADSDVCAPEKEGGALKRLSGGEDDWPLLTMEQALARLAGTVGTVAEHVSAAF